MSKRAINLLIILLTLIILSSISYFFILPLFSEITSSKEILQNKENIYNQEEKQIEELKSNENYYQELVKNLSKTYELVPKEKEIDNFIIQLEEISKCSDSVLKTIKIVTSTEVKTLKKTEETKQEKVPFTQMIKNGEFYIMPFEATLLNTFPSLLKYLEFSDGSRSYFPDRKTKKVEYRFDESDENDQYAKLYSDFVVSIIENLELPRYGLKMFIDQDINPIGNEESIIQNLSRAGQRLIGFCRTNLFKRLESSGYSFLLSLYRHVIRNFIFIYALERDLPVPIGKQSFFLYEENYDEDIEKDIEDDYIKIFPTEEEHYFKQAGRIYNDLNTLHKHRFSWVRRKIFKNELLNMLIHDSREILRIIESKCDWDPIKDRQLNALIKLITEEHKSQKILIFTQFADTAKYLYNQIVNRGVKDVGCVTGSSEDPTSYAHKFSPVSNDKVQFAKKIGELRVLISTDVLSEGQNLQDAHIVLNYDLPWAIIRLIQRAGRVDRIGQKSSDILCYSFLPEDGIERIISLRRRLTNRIKQNAEVVGSDEVFFEGDPINIVDLYSEKSGILEEEEEVDLASFAYQIWKNAIEKNKNLEKIIPELPNVVYSTKKVGDENINGAIVYTKTTEDNDILALINSEGQLITHSPIRILKEVQCDPDTESLDRLINHHDLVRKAVEFAQKDEDKLAGTLGRKSGIRYRLYMRLKQFCEDKSNHKKINDLIKRSVDDIFKYPLKQSAADTISRQMKSGISDEELSELVSVLREDGILCIINEEEEQKKIPQIICSMGVKNREIV